MGSQRLAFPLRFACEGDAVQTTSRELSESGVYVRCVEPPAVGVRVELMLYLPTGTPLEVPALVGERSEAGSESGFRADFLDLGPEAFSAIAATLAGDWGVEPEGKVGPAAGAAKASREHRFLRRFSDRIQVKLGAESSAPGELALNLNASGLFVLLHDPQELGTRLLLLLELPDGLPPAQVQGEVVRRVTAAQAERRGTAPGAAFLFIGASDAFRARYDAYLKKLASR